MRLVGDFKLSADARHQQVGTGNRCRLPVAAPLIETHRQISRIQTRLGHIF